MSLLNVIWKLKSASILIYIYIFSDMHIFLGPKEHEWQVLFQVFLVVADCVEFPAGNLIYTCWFSCPRLLFVGLQEWKQPCLQAVLMVAYSVELSSGLTYTWWFSFPPDQAVDKNLLTFLSPPVPCNETCTTLVDTQWTIHQLIKHA